MRCEKCGHKLKVVDSGERHGDVLRERKCVKCGAKYYTREFVDITAKTPLKKARNKTTRGMENELYS